MKFSATRLPYRQTGAFSKISLDYIDQLEELKPFFEVPPSMQGIQQAIENRKNFKTDREKLVAALKEQYNSVPVVDKVSDNIDALLNSNTFTVCTAHQNNIFTGPLYFIYKIIHAIKLADRLNESLSSFHFVPVFYMGSEDADIDELNHIYLGGEKISWETKQKGAVGRMKIDKAFVSLIDRIEGELSVLPEGNSIIALLRRAYKEGISIQDATFYFVNELFSDYGLIVLIADHPTLKSLMLPVFSEELFDQSSVSIVDKSGEGLESAGYKVQAHAREINLFYLKDDIRERITRKGDSFAVTNTNIGFSESALRDELSKHPDRFSPNVILRGLYQETILPNIAFIGGGGELAYWLQLKSLFDHYKVPFPVLLLRNSFMVLETKHISVMEKLGLPTADIFLPADEMIQRFVLGKGKQEASLNGSIEKIEELYAHFKEQAGSIDSTLATHVEALKKSVLYRLHELEKKMWKAEKRKYSDEQRQVKRIKSQLFPSNGLQERTANLSYYYAKWGRDFLNEIYLHSPTLEQEFVILSALTGD